MGRGRRRGRQQNGFESGGGYMAVKKAKLEEQFSEDAVKEKKNDGIFAGVAIFVNGYTDPTADELKRIMMVHGGTYHHYESSKTTHIIATNLPDSKVKALKGHEVICHPDWIVDSLAAERLLDFTRYLLYSNRNKAQPKLSFSRDAKDDNFLGEFYNNSRLHHISTMGSSFKEYVNELRAAGNDEQIAANRRRDLLPSPDFSAETTGKVIMHIDMDCFFVSVGLRKRPELRGRPVAVTHAKNANNSGPNSSRAESVKIEAEQYRSRLEKKFGQSGSISTENEARINDIVDSAGTSMSEIASCSYEARKSGVKNGMFLGAALKLCPDLQTIPYDFDDYQKVARTLYDTVAAYTLDVQAVSCDEMLVDLTSVMAEARINPVPFAEHLRRAIHDRTDCTASVGLGSSPLLARMATRRAKPDGVFHLLDSEAGDFMAAVKVSDLPGVGRTVNGKLRNLGVETCGDLQAWPLQRLQRELGAKLGQSLHDFCRGLDDRVVNFDQERKSVSAEVNYGIRFNNSDDMEKFLGRLSGEVSSRLEKCGGLQGRSITLKVMVRSKNAPKETAKFMGHGLCDSHSKSSSLARPTCDAIVIKRQALALMKMLNVDPVDLRGVGIQVGKLEAGKRGQNMSIASYMSTSRTEQRPSYKLSAEKIDPKVLSELPDEIRREIELEYNLVASKDEPTCSGSKSSSPELRQEDMSFSQMDESVLAQLPDDLVAELRQQKRRRSPEKKPSAFDTIMANKGKKCHNSPVQRRRGRPPKNSPRFIKSSAKKCGNPEVRKSLFSEDVEEIPEPAQLDGKRQIEDLRATFRQWVSHSEAPTPDDVDQVVDFLEKVVRERDTELVFLALKSLRRLCASANSSAWSAASSKIVDTVQNCHEEVFEAKKLFVNFNQS